MIRLVSIVRRLARSLDVEDVVVLTLPWLVASLRQSTRFSAWVEAARDLGPLHPSKLLPFLALGGGLWAVLAARRAPREWDIWARLHVIAAWAGILLGVPMLFIVLSNGDTGVIYIYGALFALLSFGAVGVSRSPRALTLTDAQKRWLLLPFTALSTWYATDHLVGEFVYDPHHVALIADPLSHGDVTALALGLMEAGFMSALMFVPYVLLVIFPRFIVDNVEPPGVWARRYLMFVVSVLLGLVALVLGG